MLLAEDLLLLLLDDEKGSFTAGDSLDPGIGGAILAELALAGAVEVRNGRWPSSPKVHVAPAAAVEEPILAESLAVVGQRPRAAKDVVRKLGKGRRTELLERLETRGLVERREDQVLGLFPRTRWPAADSAREEQVRAELTAVLAGAEPGPRSGALIALLQAMGAAHKVLAVPGLSQRDVRGRAKVIAEGEWAATAVRDAVQAAQAAVVAAAGAATAGSS